MREPHVRHWIWLDRALIVLVLLVALLCVYVGVARFWGTLPLFSVAQITDITKMRFPEGTKLLDGYDRRYGSSEMMLAKLRMTEPAFRRFAVQMDQPFQAQMPGYDLMGIEKAFSRQGWEVSGIRDRRWSTFANGSMTCLLADKDRADVVTLYILYDEP